MYSSYGATTTGNGGAFARLYDALYEVQMRSRMCDRCWPKEPLDLYPSLPNPQALCISCLILASNGFEIQMHGRATGTERLHRQQNDNRIFEGFGASSSRGVARGRGVASSSRRVARGPGVASSSSSAQPGACATLPGGKAALCPWWEMGEECLNGDNCPNAHGVAQLETRICWKFQDRGFCTLGDACPFLHKKI